MEEKNPIELAIEDGRTITAKIKFIPNNDDLADDNDYIIDIIGNGMSFNINSIRDSNGVLVDTDNINWNKKEISITWVDNNVESNNKLAFYIGHINEKGEITGNGNFWIKDVGIYSGNFVNGLLDGNGNFTNNNGDIYDFNFTSGKADGTGQITYKNGNFYVCEFENGRMADREGKFYWSKSGITFMGSFLNGLPSGNGKFFDQNGYSFECNIAPFEAGKFDIIYKNGIHYRGEVVDGLPHGEGEFVDQNRNVSKINITPLEPFGLKKFDIAYRNGIHYRGEVVDGLPHGEGEFIDQNGVASECTIIPLEPGKFDITYKNGSHYRGDVVNGKFHGYGKYTYSDAEGGGIWEGAFIDGEKADGRGIIRFEDGTIYMGEFVLGTFHGDGELIYSDGIYWKGKFEKGEAMDGNGTIRYKNGDYKTGLLVKGEVMNGIKVVKGEDGYKYVFSYEKGGKIGENVFDENDNVVASGPTNTNTGFLGRMKEKFYKTSGQTPNKCPQK